MHLNDFFTQLNEQALNEGVNDPGIFKAVFMAGPPGAGKNVVISRLGLQAAGLKMQDIDKTLHYLKQHNPNATYDRSLAVTQGRQNVLTKNMLGLIINTTGRDSSRVIQLKKELERSGYDTFMVFVEVDYSIALDRIGNREQSATDPADKRAVDRDYFDSAYDSCAENASFYAMMFGSQFAYVTNNFVDPQEEVIDESDSFAQQAREDFEATMQFAEKKVRRFLAKPLTPIASEIVGAAKKRSSYQ